MPEPFPHQNIVSMLAKISALQEVDLPAPEFYDSNVKNANSILEIIRNGVKTN